MTPGRIDRRLVVLTFTAAVSTLTIACTSQDSASGRREVSVTTSDAVSSEPTDSLEGSWVQDEVPCSVRHQAVIDAGFTDADWKAQGPDLCAEIGGEYRFLDGMMISLNPDGSVGWEGTYGYEGDHTVVLEGLERITIDFAIEGDTLTLSVVRLTGPLSKRDMTAGRVIWIAAAEPAPWTRAE